MKKRFPLIICLATPLASVASFFPSSPMSHQRHHCNDQQGVLYATILRLPLPLSGRCKQGAQKATNGDFKLLRILRNRAHLR